MTFFTSHADTSRADLPHSTPGVYLPVEIFLSVVDAAIANAEHDACMRRQQWTVDAISAEDDGRRITMNGVFLERSAECYNRRLRRFSLLRSLSQVNSTARKMIHRHFPRIEETCLINTAKNEYGFTWICPKLDVFLLEINSRTTRLQKALLRSPTMAKDLPLIRGVEIAALLYVWELLILTPRQTRAILRFDNLKVLIVYGCQTKRPLSASPPPTGQVVPVDVGLFSVLEKWLANGHTLDELCERWRPLFDRKVRVMVYDKTQTDGNHSAVEFLKTPAGLRMRFVAEDYVYY